MDNKIFLRIAEVSPVPVFIHAEGVFYWLNMSACHLFGAKLPEELTGMPLVKSVSPDYHDDFLKWIGELNKNITVRNKPSEYKLILRNGKSVWVRAESEPLTFEGKDGAAVFILDVIPYKQADLHLKSSYTLLKMAGEISKFGGWSIDIPENIDELDNQTIIWSEAVASIHETPVNNFPSLKEGVMYYAPVWRDKIRAVFMNCVQKGIPFNEEMEIITAKGNKVWIRTMGEAVWEGGKIMKVQGALQDISLIKQASKELKASEEKFRSAFHNHPVIKLIIDPENGNIIDVNKAATCFYGWTDEEMKKMNISDIVNLPVGKIKKKMEQAADSPDIPICFRHKKADGEVRDVEMFGSKIEIGGKEFMHSIVLDVTEKKNTENRLKLLSRSLEQSPVSVVITDIKGHIEYVNPVFTKITGYCLEELNGKTLRILKSGYHSLEFYKDLWATILSGKDWNGELRNKKKNGQLYWEQAIISPVLNEQEQITNFVCISEDITERKMMVEQLTEAKEKAEESDRLKSAFLANMSHEIRTPMNGIMGFTQMLKDADLTSGQQKEVIDKIEKSGKRMLNTLGDLIDIARIETGTVNVSMSETDLNLQLENLYDFFGFQAKQKNLQFTVKYPVPSRYNCIVTDRMKLDSILTNLIKNAIKFTDKGKIEVGMTPKDDYLEFYVSDTGIGVPRNFQKAIFNRFERAETVDAESFDGSGLGLAISKAYVKLLGGNIWVESEPGKGSTFYFTILYREPEAPAAAREERTISEMHGIPQLDGKTILVVEDDPFSMEMLTFMLKKTGARLLVAKDGREAVTAFQNGNVNLVLLDIRLPEMNGYEVLREIRTLNPEVIVIAQTAYALEDDIHNFQEAGFTDYLTKPISQNNMYTMLSKYFH